MHLSIWIKQLFNFKNLHRDLIPFWICSAEAAPRRSSYYSAPYGVTTWLVVVNGDLVVSKNHLLKMNTVFQQPTCPNNTKFITRPIFGLYQNRRLDLITRFSRLWKWQVWVSVGFGSAFNSNRKREKFVLSPCFIGDKKELTLKRLHVTLAGRSFQACHA